MPDYLELEVSLADLRPRVWRRFLLTADGTFADLHQAIQDAFGWENAHLFDFRTTGRPGQAIAGVPMDDGFSPPMPDAVGVPLAAFFDGAPGHDRCVYTYDFGDDWRHEVKLGGVVTERGRFERRLLDGARSGPPEDCGGAPGYERLALVLETGADPWGEDVDDLREWIGGWRPDAFELEAAQRTFNRPRPRARSRESKKTKAAAAGKQGSGRRARKPAASAPTVDGEPTLAEPVYLKAFFAAAADLYRSAPWKSVPGDSVAISVTIESLDLHGAALSVLGSLGQHQALLFFADGDTFEHFLDGIEAMERGEQPSLPGYLMLTYERASELEPAMRELVGSGAIELAGPAAFPVVMVVGPGSGDVPGAEDLPPRPVDLAVVEAVARALPTFLADPAAATALEGGPPLTHTRTVPTVLGPVEITLAAPHPVSVRSALPPEAPTAGATRSRMPTAMKGKTPGPSKSGRKKTPPKTRQVGKGKKRR